MIIDRLYEEVRKKGFVCVGLDSHLDYIPKKFKEKYEKLSDVIFEYNKAIIDATCDIVAIYKPQIAYYEANGLEGLIAYQKTMKYLKEKNILSIGDIKRGDIASTAKEYAKSHFKGEFEADFITLNPYMGMDSITPYLEYLKNNNKGIFVLLRTSNEGAKDIECLNYNDKPLYFEVGDKLKKFADELVGECGYSSLGFVVGATHSEEAKEIRERYNNIFFLLPGYGAQGAKAEDIRSYLADFNGGVVNSSRGIIKYYQNFEDGEEKFEHYTREAVLNMRKDIYGE